MIEELELVRAFRADEPPPRDEVTASARRALDRSMAPRRPRGRRRLQAALALALVAAGIVLAGELGSPTATSPPASTAAVLEQLARVAAAQAWSGEPGPGQYMYTRSMSLTEVDTVGPGPGECQVLLHQVREIWIATNGAGAIRETNSRGRFTSAADAAVCRGDHIINPNSQGGRNASRFGPGGLSGPVHDWHALSTDPARLLVQLRRLDGGPRGPGEDFVHVGDFLRGTDAPPVIRATLYRAAELIPGVRLLGPVRDQAGRTGLGVAFWRDGRPVAELIFDRATARLLGEDSFSGHGALAGWTVYLDSRIVDHLPSPR